jgi:putative restriction endonuclease
MSTRDTIILDRNDLRFLLIDSLKQYSNSVEYIEGRNPYRFVVNKKSYYILIKNVHESGDGRSNQDECRIQVSKSLGFDEAVNSQKDIVVLGYFPDMRVFTAWDPVRMRDRFNVRSTISLYSRFSIVGESVNNGISLYIDNNDQHVISFRPEYLGLYLENIKTIHRAGKKDLYTLIEKSDSCSASDESTGFTDSAGDRLTVTRIQVIRDPRFRADIYRVYDRRCAICGIQLNLVEAAHIIPHSHDMGTDDIKNGVCLCSLHHSAYDQSLIYFDECYNVKVNKDKVRYLEKIKRDSGLSRFLDLGYESLILPVSQIYYPLPSNITLANKIRGIVGG